MTLLELDQNDINSAYYDSEGDDYNVRRTSDVRKPKLTLKHINRLKKMRAAQELERIKKSDLLQTMYGAPDEDAGGGGGMGF